MEIDYEKAYIEALERAKGLRDSYFQTMNAKRVVEEIFPELCESEDERIRKELIAILKASYNSGITLNNKKDLDGYLAYLEKQKDASKAIEAVDRIDKYIDEHVANAHDMKDSNPDKKYYRGWDDALGKMAGILQDVYSEAEQKEQTSDIILKAFENSKTDYSLEEREEASDYSEKVLPTSIACGESDEEFLLHKVIEAAYIAGQKEQKPPIAGNDFGWIDELKHDLEHPEELDQKVDDVLKQRKGIRALEWSEEDEHRRNDAIYFLESAMRHYADTSEIEKTIAWLKSLRSQQKEQDVEKYPEDKSFEDEWKDYYNNSLVSRRPMNKREVAKHFYWFVKKNAWKPSEEQMRVLKQVEDRVAMKSGYLEQVLDSLYCDLQKL